MALSWQYVDRPILDTLASNSLPSLIKIRIIYYFLWVLRKKSHSSIFICSNIWIVWVMIFLYLNIYVVGKKRKNHYGCILTWYKLNSTSIHVIISHWHLIFFPVATHGYICYYMWMLIWLIININVFLNYNLLGPSMYHI